MINRHKQFVLFFILYAIFQVQYLFAQNLSNKPGHYHDHPVFSAIQQEVINGRLTKEEALLQSIYAGFKPERLHPQFRTFSDQPVKCLTPVLIEYERTKESLNPGVVAEIEELISVSTSAQTLFHISPSGNFILYYEIDGQNAVPLEDLDENGTPDYVEKTAFAADSSYRYEVETIGFRDFLKDEPYEIYFQNFPPYGTTTQSGSTTYITVHNNFVDFPPNTHPEGDQTGAIYATIAHEVKHAIQFATNRWEGEAGDFPWIEMDATMMEEIVFDDVNDYYNYIMHYDDERDDWDRNRPHRSSIFGSPDHPIPGSYNHITWTLYFAEMYGMQFWVDVWEEIRTDYLNQQGNEDFISFLEAMNRGLSLYGEVLEHDHIQNHLWHMTAGPNLDTADFGFEERTDYPNPVFHHEVQLFPNDSLSVSIPNINIRASKYIDITPSSISLGQPKFNLISPVNGIGFGVVGYFKDGSTDFVINSDPSSFDQSIQSTWFWKDLVRVRIAIVNLNSIVDENSTLSTITNNNSYVEDEYTLIISSVIPQEDEISYNYPNPFNQTTNIRFSLSETKDVKVEVYDRIGRKISTLINDRLNRGFHTLQFDGSGLASGVYFYRIITDQIVSTKKMVLVK